MIFKHYLELKETNKKMQLQNKFSIDFDAKKGSQFYSDLRKMLEENKTFIISCWDSKYYIETTKSIEHLVADIKNLPSYESKSFPIKVRNLITNDVICFGKINNETKNFLKLIPKIIIN